MTTNKQELAVTASRPIASSIASAAEQPQPRILRRMLALDDFEDAARRILPRPIFGYASGVQRRTRRCALTGRSGTVCIRAQTLVDTTAHADDDTVRAYLRCALRDRAVVEPRWLHIKATWCWRAAVAATFQ
jgi:hypothetical protein